MVIALLDSIKIVLANLVSREGLLRHKQASHELHGGASGEAQDRRRSARTAQ
jgi:hypothetical protein